MNLKFDSEEELPDFSDVPFCTGAASLSMDFLPIRYGEYFTKSIDSEEM